MRIALLPSAAALVLVIATVSIARTQPRRETHQPPSVPPRSIFVRRVAAAGLVEASSENISLSAHLPGVVSEVLVVAGQEVKAGEPLVRLDLRALEASRAERRADLATRQAAVTSARARATKAVAAQADARRTLGFAEALTDSRSISAEELTRRRSALEIAAAEVQAAEAEIVAAEASVASAFAALESVATDLERSTITSPIDGRVLQVRIRPGEYAPAGVATVPWLVVGRVDPLHVRVDIDEHEAWRVRSGAAAEAQVRGQASLRTPLALVRFEPLVVPKQSLTGASSERVDTRVMQAVYRVERRDLPLYVGQQMDVFIEASEAEADSALASR